MKKLLKNNKGIILITSYLVLASLLTLTAGLTTSSISELNYSRRFRDAAAAFWAAEAGANRFLSDTTMLDGVSPEADITIGSYTVHVEKDDSDAQARLVTATGTANGISRTIQMTFPSLPPDIFDNTVSTGGNFRSFGGSFSTSYLNVYDKTRLGGTYVNNAINLSTTFEDKLQSQDTANTTLKYPDANNNGTADEFSDFKAYNQELISNYPPEDVVYVTPNAGETVVIYPNKTFDGENLVGKKIIYVEGPNAGDGDVQLWFDATNWQDDQNVTIISTGTVTYVQPLQGVTNNSKLNAIAWDDYSQGSVITSRHDGTVYAHDDALFTEILSDSETTGNVIANDLLQFTEFLQTDKDFFYADPIIDGLVPPGFEGLIGGGGGGYATTPSLWKEI